MSKVDAVWHDYHADEGVCVEPKDGVYDNGGSPANSGEQESWTGYVDVEAYSSEQILSLVEIAPAPGKGRCMYTRRAYEPGEIIIIEKPLFAITPDSNRNIWDTLMTLHQEQPLHLPPLWHHAALVSILEGNEEKLEIMKGKWVLDNDPPVSEDVYRILEVTCAEHRDGSFVYHNGTVICPNLYQFLLQVWPLNAFAHSTHPQGLVIYDKISYLAHSCDSSATWNHYGEDIFVLRARRKLQIGDELTISYIGEADLLAPTPRRRKLLQNWAFRCGCQRCIMKSDAARGFLCKRCQYGRINLFSDPGDEYMNSDPCTSCGYTFTQEDISTYIQLEDAYIDYIDNMDRSNIQGIQQVYNNAKNVFNQHWCIYQLQTMLFEIYKEKGDTELSRHYMNQRISYLNAVMPRPLYSVAFTYEEFADMLSASAGLKLDDTELVNHDVDIETLRIIMDLYYKAVALLYILAGQEHPYYYAVATKLGRIDALLNEKVPPQL